LEKAQTNTRSKRSTLIIKHTSRGVIYRKDNLVRIKDLPGGIKRFKLKGNKPDG